MENRFENDLDAFAFKPHKSKILKSLQTSRRGFLSNLAILTAGVAFCNNASGIFSESHKAADVEQLWKIFCQLQQGTDYSGEMTYKNELTACKGHVHVEGKPIYFSKDQLIAHPVWIYWANNKNKPSDVIINFSAQDGDHVASLNQFELKALTILGPTSHMPNDKKLASLLKIDSNGKSSLIAKITIKNNRTTTQFS